MTPVVLDIPDDPAQWPNWLERQIVGMHLGELVSELPLITGARAGRELSLETALGGKLDDVLLSGLAVLAAEQVRALLRQPQLLLELQERVLVDGGAHWSALSRDRVPAELLEDGWERIAARLDRGDAPVAPIARINPSTGSTTRRTRRRIVTISAAAAAVALVALTLWLQQPAATGWGWDKPGVFTANLPADQYLNHLADGANDWFNKRPDTPAALARRLREFRHGCDTLIAAPHTPLAQADRDWLVERCRVWSGKLDGHLVDLQAGTKPVEQVRAEADATVRKLMQAIRDRAAAA